MDFVAKRELIQNILNEKWDAYEVRQPKVEDISKVLVEVDQ
jgi:hypothetical protein